MTSTINIDPPAPYRVRWGSHEGSSLVAAFTYAEARVLYGDALSHAPRWGGPSLWVVLEERTSPQTDWGPLHFWPPSEEMIEGLGV